MRAFRVKRSYPFEALLLILTIIAAILYYFIFVAQPENKTILKITNPTNSHDHHIYANYIENLNNIESMAIADNNIGIAIIYKSISEIVPAFLSEDITILAAALNTITLLACFFVYRSICNTLALGTFGRLSFFINTSLLYFTQLINKDLFTIFLILFATHCGLQNRKWPLLAAAPLFFLVRQQLIIFLLLFILIQFSKNTRTTIFFAYVITSLLGGLISTHIPFIGEETLGSGFSSLVNRVNQEYFIGYLLLNPIRVIQFIQDALLVFIPITSSNELDVAKILRIPPVALLISLSLFLIPSKGHLKIWFNPPAKALTSTIIAFTLTWLMNPTINARYVMLIVPSLTLLAIYTNRQKPKPPYAKFDIHRRVPIPRQ